jgi:hypothetical protein
MWCSQRDGAKRRIAWESRPASGEGRMVSSDRLDPDLVRIWSQAIVTSRVSRVAGREPALVNAAWDWGAGDWETMARPHMGRRDIALYLLERGARMDVFAAAILGTWTSCGRQSPRFHRRGHGKAARDSSAHAAGRVVPAAPCGFSPGRITLRPFAA